MSIGRLRHDRSSREPLQLRPPETVIDPEPAEAIAALAEAESAADPIAAIGSVCTQWPTFLAAWASLGDAVAEPALKYAAYRTGYHRVSTSFAPRAGVAAGMSAGNTRPTGAFFVRSPACRPPLRSSASRPRMSAVRSSCGNSTRSGRRRDLRGRSRSRWRCKHSDGSSQGLHRGRREDIA